MQDQSLETAERPRHQDGALVIGDEMSVRAKVVNSLVLLVLVTVSVAFVWLMSSLPRIEGRVPVKGLQLPASVARDHQGVPRITARTVRDGYFVLGWVHAQDRIWQMELQRRIGTGRLAELVGEKGLGNDRFMRTLGLEALARQSYDALDKPTRDALDAYAEGVNAWLRDHPHRLPMEFLLLGARPEPWKATDALVWARLMALQLTNNWRDELLRAQLAGKLGARRVGELWPGYPADAPVTVSGRTATGLLDILPATAEPRLASNVWVVDGSRTASGKPLLANDPHLGFQAPILWYLASIDAPGLSVAGATVPGVPFHLVGHNTRIAWGTTTTHADTVDLFVETLVDGDTYRTPDGPRSLGIRHETIRVKGGADVALAVRETRNGPVISDLLPPGLVGPDQVVALRATALEPVDTSAQAIYKLNRAVDWRGFQAALKDYHSPVQNMAFADTAGAIGFLTAGRVPRRASGDGTLPVAAASGRGDWTGWVPSDRMPRMASPKSGQIVNANNKVTGAGYPYLVSALWPEGYRAQRLADLLEGRGGLTLGDMTAMQMDELSLAAVELKELMDDAQPTDPVAAEAARLVAAWDGAMAAGRPEPLVFSAWADQLWRAVFADELGEDFRYFSQVRPYVLRDALTVNRHWCDDISTPEPESCDQMATRALEAAVREVAARRGPAVAAWRWGDEHVARFDHPILRGLPVLGELTTLQAPTGGDDFTVNRGTYAKDFTQVHGAGLRAVFDLGDLTQSRFVIAAGQSGNVLSRHYDDFLPRWLANDGVPVGVRPAEPAVLVLEPGY